MNKNQLLYYAIMNVNDSNNVDYFDHFVPFVKEALRVSGTKTISSNELKKSIKAHFKIDLPISVVNTILKRKLLQSGYIKRENKTLIPDFDKLQESKFNELKQKMLEKHEKLIDEIALFAHERYELKVEKIKVEEALEAFLEKHQLVLLETSLLPSSLKIKDDNKKQEGIDIIISQYIKSIYAAQSVSFEYLIDIVKGNMLTNTLYYKEDVHTINMKFKGTEVFFDSTFLIYALGLAGEARQEPCLELIQMLRKSNAILKVLRINIDEINGILEWCKNNLTTCVSDHHGTISYFLDNGFGPSDIERIIYALEKELEEKLHISIVDSVGYEEYTHVISHEGLDDCLKNNMTYRRESARERDVQAVSAIMRLRKGWKTIHIENSRAIFVTNNFSLAQNVKNYFYDENNPRIIPPVLHDSVITNLMWLKNPSEAPDLPRQRLIAETFAATHPQEHLWKRYIEAVNIFESTNQGISQEDIVRLRYSQGAREILMEKTLGNEDLITIGTVKEILAEIKNQEELKINELSTEKEKEIEELKGFITVYKQEVAATTEIRAEKILKIAKKRAKWITDGIFLLISLFIGVIIYFVPYIQSLNFNSIIKNVVIFGLVTIPSVLGLLNINLIPFKTKTNNYLEEKILLSIKRKYL
ncbi:hypothetical protein RGU12_01945 [Fredinandcohnia sp. QZ13]|uniref:hypothetical protein n=1 Tax=Fredinandcohnia sp. QZ13 TaxID=3073144 RepID=UPI00285328B5|nr:hypothetical protein [Fredinandcohnia sp. QZ13]MDR4886305.1 hypothetical protein [Fredinandcohnia sp. QZ13]